MTDNSQTNQVNDSINISEDVAVTGSPNTVTEVNFDVRSNHLRNPLLGTLLSMQVPVQSSEVREELLVLGQVASIETKNRWHEDESLKNYIKLHGHLPHLTEIGDNSHGIFQVFGAYRETIISQGESFLTKVRLTVPPGSGLPLHLVAPETIHNIMRRDSGYGYLGGFYGTNNVPAPVYVRHFGNYDEGGTGEAYMGGIFGTSGSGKSVIAASLIALWSHNPQMGILILDPQSEFSENAFGRGQAFEFDFHGLLSQFSNRRFDPRRDVVRLNQIQLEGTDIFVQILVEKGFFRGLGIGGQKISDSSEYVQTLLENLRVDGVWNCSMDWHAINELRVRISTTNNQRQEETLPFLICREAANSYTANNRATRTEIFLTQWESQNRTLETIWNDTVALFSDQGGGGHRYKVLRLLRDTIINGQIKILDLDPVSIRMNPDFKLYLINFIFRKLRELTHQHYVENNPGNCLIVLDEAGRYIPQESGDNELKKELCKKITDSVKEMRKMRCGFMFITQTVAEIQKEIYRNLHFRIYGVGLGIGVDADHIRAREGNEAFELYRSLPEPRLTGTYSFMIGGVLLALGSSGRPMIIEGYSNGQYLLDNNPQLLQSQQVISLGNIGSNPDE